MLIKRIIDLLRVFSSLNQEVRVLSQNKRRNANQSLMAMSDLQLLKELSCCIFLQFSIPFPSKTDYYLNDSEPNVVCYVISGRINESNYYINIPIEIFCKFFSQNCDFKH